MADSSRTIMTDAGFALETRVRADETKMQFTRAAISTDDHFGDTDDTLAKLTELADVQQDGKVTAVQVINTTTVHVQVDVNQAESKADYQMRSAALYAKDDDGTEILYGVTVLQDPVFVHKDADGSYLGFGINTTVGKASNVVVVVDPANMVTQQVFESTMKNYYTKAEVDAKFVTDDDFASKLPKNIATTDASNTFTKTQTFAGGAMDGQGNAYATTKDVATGDASTLSQAKGYTDTATKPLATSASVTAGDSSTLATAKAYTADQSARAATSSTNLLKNSKFDQGMYRWRIWGPAVDGNSVAVAAAGSDWNAEVTNFIHIKKTVAAGQWGIAQDDVPVIPNSQYTMSVYATGNGRVYLQHGNDGNDAFQNVIIDRTGHLSLSFTFTVGNTTKTNIYYGFGEGDTGDIWISLAKLNAGAYQGDWSPAPEDIDASASIGRPLTADDDVYQITPGIYPFYSSMPKNGPTSVSSYVGLSDVNGNCWGYFRKTNLANGTRFLEFWDIFGHHLTNNYSGSPGSWQGWTIPNADLLKPFIEGVEREGADMNTQTVPGNYFSNTAIKNGPPGMAIYSGWTVDKAGDSNVIHITLYHVTGEEYHRTFYASTGWGPWKGTVLDNGNNTITVNGTTYAPVQSDPTSGNIAKVHNFVSGVKINGHLINIDPTNGLTIDGTPLINTVADEATAKAKSANDKLHLWVTKE